MPTRPRVISFNCVLRDPLGRVISTSFNHDVMTLASIPPAPTGGPQASHFDFHEPLQDVVEELQDLKKGERRQIRVSAEKAYGLYDPELLIKVPRKKFPQGEALEVGFQVVTQSNDGECRVFRVVEADEGTVTIDGNHPLAGQDLCFDIEATSARDATSEEMASAAPEVGQNPALLH